MGITLRNTKGVELSYNELDTNFAELYNSSSISGTSISLFSHGTGSFTAVTHSMTINTGSTFTLYSESGSTGTVTGTFVVSGSSNMTGNLTVDGTLTATELVTNIVSSSITLTSGSNIFGDEASDKHEFTGSVEITGRTKIGNSNSLNHSITGSTGVSGSLSVTGSLLNTGSINQIGTLSVTGDSTLTGNTTLTNSGSTSVTITDGYIILTEVSQSLNFADDTAAAAGGIPLGGLYRNGNFIQIRTS